jgi:hypothetical protein
MSFQACILNPASHGLALYRSPILFGIFPDAFFLNPVSFIFVPFIMQIVDPAQIPNWNEILLRTPDYSFFHSSSWARVLKESYGYTPNYFVEMKNGRFSILVPIMEITSLLTGKRGVSLPFTDYVDPIVQEGDSSQELFKQILEFGKKKRWKYFELRGVTNLFPQAPPFIRYIGHTLNLARKEEEIFSDFRDSTRRNIKKALSQGVLVKNHDNLKAVKEFYRLNSMTRKVHGLPPQPFCFFQGVHTHIISQGAGFVVLASHRGSTVAGAVFFHFGGKAIFKYGASDPGHLHLRANNLIMWEGIKRLRQKGCQSLCFGRTESENTGLGQYKMGWGVEEKALPYFKFNLHKMEFTTRHSKSIILGRKIFQKIPIPVLNLTGSLLYRHIG